jgi:sugar phosphate isomerase/epimerase
MPNPTIGAHTFGFAWTEPSTVTVERLTSFGFSNVQLMAIPPHFDPWATDRIQTRIIRGHLERTNARLLAVDLSSADVNLASSMPEAVTFGVDAYISAMDRCEELGAKAICVASGRRHALLDHVNDRLTDVYRDAFERIHEEAQKRSLGVVLENHPQGLLATADQIEAFLAAGKYPGVTVCYDVANAFAVGEDPVAGLTRLMPRLSIVHLSDSPKGQWRHDPIGTGDIDFRSLGKFLTASSFTGPVVLEILSPTPFDDLNASVAKLIEQGWEFTAS